jgi:hypothetical protein
MATFNLGNPIDFEKITSLYLYGIAEPSPLRGQLSQSKTKLFIASPL